jgi:hypothetical protein
MSSQERLHALSQLGLERETTDALEWLILELSEMAYGEVTVGFTLHAGKVTRTHRGRTENIKHDRKLRG